MSPRAFALFMFRLNVVVCTFATVLGYALGHGLSHHFDEGRISTYLSCGQLLLTAFFAWRTLLVRRRQIPWSGWRTPWVVWFFVAAGFVYLALDDALRFHERIDHLIHKIFHLHETGLSDRIDDLIIPLYGVMGLAVLYVYRRELLSLRKIFPYLGWGVFLMLVQSGFDALGDRDDVLTWIFKEPNLVWRLRDLTELAEGVTEAIAEGFLLAAFYAAFYFVRERNGLDDEALPTLVVPG